MPRAASRALAVAALLAVAVALALVLLLRGGDDGTSHRTGRASSDRSGARAAVRPTVVPGTEVRNARPQPDWQPYSGAVPIFRWNVVGEPGPEEAFSELFVAPQDFHDQMDWLDDHGYEAVTLEAVERAWSGGGTLPSKPVVLTFDGVEGELLASVEPDLRRRGWPGVLVVGPAAARHDATAVATLVAAGWEIEAEADDPGGARRSLEAEFATPVRNFAFPQGESVDEGETAELTQAGYEGATATGYGFGESGHPFDQPRITIFGLSRVDGFVEALRSRGAGVGA